MQTQRTEKLGKLRDTLPAVSLSPPPPLHPHPRATAFEEEHQEIEHPLVQADINDRKRGSASDEALKFQFIDGRDKSYSGETRKFVLKKHFARKRKLAQAITKRNKQQYSNSLTSFEELHRLEKGAVDPFDTLPLTPNRRHFYLIQYFLKMANIAYSHRSKIFDPYHDIWHHLGSRNELIMSVVLYVAANHLSTFHTVKWRTEALKCRINAMALLNRQLSNLRDDTAYESVIVSITALMTFWRSSQRTDDGSNTEIYFSNHIQGLRQVIKLHGGLFPTRARSSVADLAIIGIDIVSWGKISLSFTPISAHAVTASSIAVSLNLERQAELIPEHVQEFLGFYANMFYHSLFRRQQTGLTASSGQEQTLTRLCFGWRKLAGHCQPGGMLHRLLTQPRHPHVLGAIIYLNIVLWDLRNGPAEVFESYFDTHYSDLVTEGLDQSGMVDTLLLLLLTTGEKRHIECHQRAWLMTRLLNISHILGPDLRSQLEMDLLGFLTMTETARSRPERYSWQPESFAKEVLRDLKLLDL